MKARLFSAAVPLKITEDNKTAQVTAVGVGGSNGGNMSPHIVSPQIREICSDVITFSSQVQCSSPWFSLLGSNKHFAGNPLKQKKRKRKVIMILLYGIFIFCLNHETFFFFYSLGHVSNIEH